MTCRLSILDFDRQDLFTAVEPETIARVSRLWEKDIKDYGPWTRSRSSRFETPDNDWIWQPKLPGDGPAVLVCGQITSTMDAAWNLIEDHQMDIWDSIIAVEQTAGRGQQKRQWISPAGNIHASWLWPLPGFDNESATDWGGLLSLIAGFVFARVFKELNVPVQIKWPNDLLIYDQSGDQKSGGDRKFGGILVERRDNHILVGTGININYSPEDRLLRDQFAVPATCLFDQGFEMSPLSLWATLVEKGKSLFEKLIQNTTPAEFIKIIDTQMAWIGKKVLIRQMNTDVFEALILGLAKDGGLRIKKENIEEVIYSGSVIPL